MEVGLAALRISVCTYATGSQVGGGVCVSHVQVLSPPLSRCAQKDDSGSLLARKG